jgi:hypothetical protein
MAAFFEVIWSDFDRAAFLFCEGMARQFRANFCSYLTTYRALRNIQLLS